MYERDILGSLEEKLYLCTPKYGRKCPLLWSGLEIMRLKRAFWCDRQRRKNNENKI